MVKRYKNTIRMFAGECGDSLDEHPEGDWVEYEHYAALEARCRWQPMETAPRDRTEVFFWIIPKPVSECYTDSSGHPITTDFEPYIFKGHYKSWSALSKATNWMPLPEPPTASETAVKPSRMCPECHAVGGPDGVTICTTCASGWWEQGCEHCGSLEVNPKCPACNGIERDAP